MKKLVLIGMILVGSVLSQVDNVDACCGSSDEILYFETIIGNTHTDEIPDEAENTMFDSVQQSCDSNEKIEAKNTKIGCEYSIERIAKSFNVTYDTAKKAIFDMNDRVKPNNEYFTFNEFETLFTVKKVFTIQKKNGCLYAFPDAKEHDASKVESPFNNTGIDNSNL